MLKNKFAIVILVLLLSLTGCKNSLKVNDMNKLSQQQLIEDISFWSNEKFSGRHVGTKENQQVTDELADKLKEVGVKPFQAGKYLSPFELKINSPDKREASLSVILKDGSEKEFEYGIDWLEGNPNNKVDVHLPISFSPNKNTIYVTDQYKNESTMSVVTLYKEEPFKKTLNSSETGLPTFKISSDLYNYFKKHTENIKHVNLKFSAPEEILTTHNVIGKISGKKHKEAIVISAHIDHLGQSGKTTYLGSVDNATGISGLVKLASLLRESSETEQFNFDILLVGFNAEEKHLAGSRALVKELSKQYKSIININLDSIGIKDGGDITFVGNEKGSKEIGNILKKIANTKKYTCKVDVQEGANLTSDHVAFLEAGFIGVNVSQENFDKIHTLQDNIEYVDPLPLKNAIDIVYEFTKNFNFKNYDKLFTNENEDPNVLLENEKEKIKENLHFGELITFKSNISNSVDFTYNLQKSIDISNDNQLNKELGLNERGYTLNKITLNYLLSNEGMKDHNLFELSQIDKKKIGKVKTLKPNHYELQMLDLYFQTDKKPIFIHISKGNLISTDNIKEKVNNWIFMEEPNTDNVSNEKEKSYFGAETIISINNQEYTVRIDVFDKYRKEYTKPIPYKKNELSNILNTLNLNPIISSYY